MRLTIVFIFLLSLTTSFSCFAQHDLDGYYYHKVKKSPTNEIRFIHILNQRKLRYFSISTDPKDCTYTPSIDYSLKPKKILQQYLTHLKKVDEDCKRHVLPVYYKKPEKNTIAVMIHDAAAGEGEGSLLELDYNFLLRIYKDGNGKLQKQKYKIIK